MADRPSRFARRAVAVCLLLVAAGLPGRPPETTTTDTTRPTVLRMLQLNLCNSGRAGCYTGRSMAVAAEVIDTEAPDLVTLNEICQGDVPALRRVFEAVHRGRSVVSAFQAAGDRPSGADTRCRNGQPYGVGLLARVRTPDTTGGVYRGIHPTQDLADPEERAWLCVDVDRRLLACTTHLANTSYRVALAQCGHLLDTILPTIRGGTGAVLAGDLNLRAGVDPDVRSCTPAGHQRVDDGALQHIVATVGVTICCHRPVPMREATDHPGLLATLVVEDRPPT
ncbi:endonuclease/exonuclease/phosphatase family protein [Micromonospora chokoriensis]|uniref:Endonuclease/Exonuclease/phosphatase family protein n=1 Tax=Micromonospora chokoriensis TaxID=356851 RepID=A0A1C4Y979_9ACTN|nr:endonuclease/exonuclease/phosphatase family protein [Micromonospora chokoriensis]SCF17278.1 Endonuclease/Exonuclease/phosphatase family protein [Micromonospora chokoriensis]